jgi:hypothetical protein
MTITQEANALTKGSGYYNWSTASLGPSKVCGNHICAHGENSKWLNAVIASQREGPDKAKGGYQGHVIMHQIVVNSLVKNSKVDSSASYSGQMSLAMTANDTSSTPLK